MRILLMTDSIHIPTGMGRLARELAYGLRNRGHEIGHIGWFHPSEVPASQPDGMRCWFTNNPHHGMDILDGIVNKFQPDILFTIGDFWHLAYIADTTLCRTRRWFQWCSYIPVDGEPINGGLPPDVKAIVEDIDIPVAYTNYARAAVLKSIFDQETRNRIRTIYHGVDTNTFKPISTKEKIAIRRSRGIDEDKFIFLMVCRNQSRKNIPEAFQAWKKFSELPETKGKVIFWPHMVFNDQAGWRIDDLIEVLDLKNQSIMYYDQVAHGISERILLSDKELSELYQMSDAFWLLSGEGFGLPTFEAMATKLPCILLNHSASSELGADGRAELVKPNGSITLTGGHLTQRPLPDIDDAVRAMLKIFMDRRHAVNVSQSGYEFATQYTWDRIVDEWHNLFLEHEVPFLKPKKLEVVV